MLAYLIVAAVAIGVTALVSYVVLRISRRYQLAPEVRARDVHTNPTPRLGGIAMFLGIFAAFMTATVLPEFSGILAGSAELWAILGACTLVAVVGVLDDVFDLDWMIKLAAQLFATGILAWNGVQMVSMPVGNTLFIGSPMVNFVVTVFFMTLLMNAVNFVDGLDGLVAGVAIIASSLFFVYTVVLAAQTGAIDSVTLARLVALIVVGVCAGFLPYNWHKAKMFMGDTGSLLVGLLMGTSAMLVTGQLNPAALDQKLVLASYIPILLPLAVFALPLADFTLAMWRRVKAGKSPFTADRMHLHHRLLDMGHSPLQAVLIFYVGSAVLSVAVLLVFTLQSFVLPVIVLVVGGAVCCAMVFAPIWRRTASTRRNLLPLSGSVPNERNPE